MYAVAYKFTLLPSALAHGRRRAEAEFTDIWGAMTTYFKAECGALGSRLHRGQDGAFYAYAQWPDAQTYNAVSEITPSQDFAKLRLRWAELCAPSEILFAGPVELDLIAASPS